MSARAVLSLTIASALAAAWLEALHNGALVIYRDDTAAPAAADDPVPAGAVEWARFVIPEVGHSVHDGVATVAPLGAGVVLVTGTAGWARVEAAGGGGLMLPNVGVTDEALVLTRIDGMAGDPIAVVVWRFVVPTLAES